MPSKNVLILFSRLSDYMLYTFESYTKANDVALHVVKKRPDLSEAPFQFNLNISNIRFYEQEEFSNSDLLNFTNSLQPDLIICSGWANPKYNYVIKKVHQSITCILTMDNQYHGTFKQKLGLIYSRLYITPRFKAIWVPGTPQRNYALKLGFKEDAIFEGWYVANALSFLRTEPIKKVTKKFVFVGRYVAHKGIKDLCEAFIKAQSQNNSDWELHCIGTGPIKEDLPVHPNIKHLGFLQPEALKTYASEVGVFVLPSHFEPWGLVVQEFALAGFPLIVSNAVGAATSFVTSQSGYIYEAHNKVALQDSLEQFMAKTETELCEMGKESIILGKLVNTMHWAKTLNRLLE